MFHVMFETTPWLAIEFRHCYYVLPWFPCKSDILCDGQLSFKALIFKIKTPISLPLKIPSRINIMVQSNYQPLNSTFILFCNHEHSPSGYQMVTNTWMPCPYAIRYWCLRMLLIALFWGFRHFLFQPPRDFMENGTDDISILLWKNCGATSNTSKKH